MEHILILITPERYARPMNEIAVVRDNGDYVVDFVISEASGFDPLEEITATFVTRRGYQQRTAVGTSFIVPPMTAEDGVILKIGISQGNLMTTAYAVIPIIDSILSEGGIDIDAWNADVIRNLLGTFDSTKDGLVPHTEGGQVDEVLHADGTWRLPPGGIFPVVYNETTFEEIREAYEHDKRLPVMNVAAELYVLNHLYPREAEFVLITPGVGGTVAYLNTIDDNNEWHHREYDYYTADETDAKLRGKQDTLVLDPFPMENSGNFLTSGAVYLALQNLQNGVEPALDAENNILTTSSNETLVVQID